MLEQPLVEAVRSGELCCEEAFIRIAGFVE